MISNSKWVEFQHVRDGSGDDDALHVFEVHCGVLIKRMHYLSIENWFMSVLAFFLNFGIKYFADQRRPVRLFHFFSWNELMRKYKCLNYMDQLCTELIWAYLCVLSRVTSAHKPVHLDLDIFYALKYILLIILTQMFNLSIRRAL